MSQLTLFRRRRPAQRVRPRRVRLEVGCLEARTLLSINVLSGFDGMNVVDGGNVPPDTIAAAGPNHIVEMVNHKIAFFDKTTGANLFQQPLNEFFAPVGAAGRFIGDAVVAYDELAKRFFVGTLDFNILLAGVQSSFFYFAVSNTSNPQDGFTEMHRIDTKETVGGLTLWADYPRIGWDADAYVVNFNMFPFVGAQALGGVQVLTIDKSTVLDTNPATLTKYQVHRAGGPTGHFNMAPATMHDSAPGNPMWFVEEAGGVSGPVNNGGAALRVVKMDNVLSPTPTFTDFDMPVTPYGITWAASQRGGGVMNTFGTRIYNAAWRDNRLVASQSVDAGGVARARWYEFNTSAPSPTLTQSGEIDPGPGVNNYFPTIEIAANGDLGMAFMESSPSEFMSMYVTGQKLNEPRGVMRTPALVKAGLASYDAFDPQPHRAGDYSGITVDPVTGTSFWAANEYAIAPSILPRGNWSTWLAQFAIVEPAGASVVASSPANVLVAPSVQSLTFTFSEPMDTTSFALADVVSFTGPGGVDLHSQLANFSWLDSSHLRVDFKPQATDGSYTMIIGPNIRRASDGRPMDQDSNGIPGEVPGDRYTARFNLNCVGADGFGYTACVHPFEAIDLVPGAPGVFTVVGNVKDSFEKVDLGKNTLNFYGTVYQSLLVSSNGLVTFGSGNNSSVNRNLTFSPFQPAIATLWDNWQAGPGASAQVLGKFQYRDDGSADRLILQWTGLQHAPGSPKPVTFQVILSLNTGTNASDIVFNYSNLDSGDAAAQGASATVGIKEISNQGPNRLLVSYNNLSPFVGSGKAIRFSAAPLSSEIHGRVFDDRAPGKPGLAGWTVYLDQDRNGVREPGEPYTVTDAAGNYAFANLVPGTYTVAEEVPPGWVQSSPAFGSRAIENFESNRLGVYSVVGGGRADGNLTVPVAAHDGLFGLRIGQPPWIFRNDAAVHVAPGDTISVWAQLAGAANGRARFGFGATPAGTLSLVLAPDTNQLLLQENPGFIDVAKIAAVPQTYLANKWYRLEVAWDIDGNITGRLYDSDGMTLLNTVTGFSSAITGGGIAFQGTGSFKYFDTVTLTPGLPRAYTMKLDPRQSLSGKDFVNFLVGGFAPMPAAVLVVAPGVSSPAAPAAGPLPTLTLPGLARDVAPQFANLLFVAVASQTGFPSQLFTATTVPAMTLAGPNPAPGTSPVEKQADPTAAPRETRSSLARTSPHDVLDLVFTAADGDSIYTALLDGLALGRF